MARQEQDREDLLREATALVERAELDVPGLPENIVVGFRLGGAVSFFFGGDPVFQFNTAGQLRRAFRRGRLLKAEDGRLVELERVRQHGEVQLLRHELNDEQTAEFLQACRDQLLTLRDRLTAAQFTVVGQVPETADVAGRILRWLTDLPADIAIAQRPNVEF